MSDIYVSSSQVAVDRNRVLRNTYLLLGLSLIPTMIGAMIGVNLSFAFMRASPIMFSLGFLAVFYGLVYAIERNRESATGVYLLLGFTFLMGVLLGPILQVALGLRNGGQLVTMAAGGTSLVFVAMAGIATTTKRDLSGLGRFLSVGAIVLMVAVLASLFLQVPALHLTICAMFVLFSSLVILWQLHALVNGGETNYVSATLTLYIQIYNLFTSLLQLLMAFSGNNRD
jgi:modulator of FtsH protease